ncbi:MAG: CerR family C-terminal domain-containing protein [Pirellulales bacterium]
MSEDTCCRIVHAAGPIFAEKGFAAATIRDICAAANANQAAVNYHFGDKEALYLEVVRLAHTLRVEQVPFAEWPRGTPPADKLHRFIRATLTRMLETDGQQWPTRLMLREMLHPTIACEALVEDFVRPQLEQLLGILDEFLPESTSLHQRHQIAFSIIGQCLHYRVADKVVELLIPADELESEFRTERLVEHISQFSLAALTAWSRYPTTALE